MNIKGVRLLSGEDIIANVTLLPNVKIYSLEKPAQIMVQQGPGGKPQMGLGDFLPFAKEKKIEIDASKIVFLYDPIPEMVNAYNTSFGNGLVLAQSSLTIPRQ
jgi:hypothetical protein